MQMTQFYETNVRVSKQNNALNWHWTQLNILINFTTAKTRAAATSCQTQLMQQIL